MIGCSIKSIILRILVRNGGKGNTECVINSDDPNVS